MKVQSRLRMPSERFSSLTKRITRKSRKNVMETEAFSEACGQEDSCFVEENHKKVAFK